MTASMSLGSAGIIEYYKGPYLTLKQNGKVLF